MKFWSKNSVEVSDFRVAKEEKIFEKKNWTRKKHRGKGSRGLETSGNVVGGSMQQQQQQQQQYTFEKRKRRND